MKVVFLTKKFENGDDISEYVKSLAEALVEKGHEAAVIAFDDGTYYTVDGRVEVIRTQLHYEGDSLYSWSMMLNNEMKEKARELLEDRDFDLIHANDWTTVPGATAMKEYLDRPIVLTVHSTENERGFSDPNSPMISEMEWKGCKSADKIIVNSEDTLNSVKFDLEVPEEKTLLKNPLSEGWSESVLKIYKELTRFKEVKTE